MRKLLLIFAAIGLMAGFSGKVRAQDTNTAGQYIDYTLPSIHILNLQNVITAPVLTFAAPATAGAKIADVTNTLTWINVTSIITATKVKKIQVARTGTIPTGTTLTVAALVPTSGGGGVFGTTAGTITLNTSGSQDLVTAIGSCWTDTGVGKGYQLTYTWSVDAAYSLGLVAAASSSTVLVTYTITEVAGS